MISLEVAELEIDDLRDLDEEQLKEELEESQRSLMNLRFRVSTMLLNDTHQVRRARIRIARIKTIMRESEIIRAQSV